LTVPKPKMESFWCEFIVVVGRSGSEANKVAGHAIECKEPCDNREEDWKVKDVFAERGEGDERCETIDDVSTFVTEASKHKAHVEVSKQMFKISLFHH
jgi:hypothetical protein